MAGFYFEEFSEGQVFEHAMTRTVTETDNILFTTMTMNPQPLHLDAEFARTTEFGRPLVNSIFTLGLVIGISVGDTIHAHTTVISLRRSKSRSDAGIVEFEHVGLNQHGDMVAICRRAALMETRP